VWLDNNGGLEALVAQVDRVWSQRLVPFAAAVAGDGTAFPDPAPVDAAPVDAAPVDPTPVDPTPDERARLHARLVRAAGIGVIDDGDGATGPRFRIDVPASRTDEVVTALRAAGWLPTGDAAGGPVLRHADPGAPAEVVLRG
jgi:dephospho-CoA kinase